MGGWKEIRKGVTGVLCEERSDLNVWFLFKVNNIELFFHLSTE